MGARRRLRLEPRRVRSAAARARARATTSTTRSTSRMNSGKLHAGADAGWVANRFYYQIGSRSRTRRCCPTCPDRDAAPRLDAAHPRPRRLRLGGTTRAASRPGCGWARRCGLKREDVTRSAHVLPGVRFAVDAYVNFARRAPWQEAVCSSLTELFAPQIHKERLATWPRALPVDRARRPGLLPQALSAGAARRRARPGGHAGPLHDPRAAGARAEILQFKLDILWAMLDAMSKLRYRRRPHERVRRHDTPTPARSSRRACSACSGSRRRTATCCSTPKAWSS